MPSAEDTDLGQADYQSPRHGGLVVVPAADRARNVTTDNGAWGGEAVVRQEHTTRLHFQLEKRQKNESC